jgi:ferric-dicitrate binding protein FerR (iron transport regulator)
MTTPTDMISFDNLCSRVADGVQTPEDEQRLAEVLSRDADARRRFRRVMMLHSALHWSYASAAAQASQPPANRGPLPAKPSGGLGRIAAALMLAVTIAAGALGLLALRRNAQVAARPAATAGSPLATVTQTRFLLSAAPDTSLVVGQRLEAGRVKILGGAAEFTLSNGVTIVLEGPGDLDLRGEMEAFLHSGNAVVRVPKGMSGFRLDTASTAVLDLGTEFAVKAGAGFVTDVQVYDGAVIATGVSGQGGSGLPKRLESGQAARFSPQDSDAPQAIAYSEHRFVRRLKADVGIEHDPNDDRANDLRRFGRPQVDSIAVSRPAGAVVIDGRLDDWFTARGFTSSRDGTAGCAEWADGRMMYDGENLYIAAHVGDPKPLRSVIDPEVDAEDGWRGGGIQVRLSTDRTMGWPVAANAAAYFNMRHLVPTEDEEAAARNPRLSHLTMWFHAPSQTPCLTIAHGMLADGFVVNPVGFRGAFARDADGRGYVLEYSIPWRLLNCVDAPPQPGDTLAAVWQVHWSDGDGRLWRDQMVEVRNSAEPLRIHVWERGATWGRAEYQ